ncbi:swi5-dependent recombination DNA repair protein 1 homolog [Triplophysa dalaica]|uniref:swi5-dependent recombination DNA repair protein 1 homolog n=1 Tax=Triplophysa dalaica TaxID=1582913 RepID=UPI0024E016CE|nr:swi5-dependent recombination DNA repair protein 1 homolog [Triplophysa dalaica]XP_056617539.1 swi5-dependent recombination DNA repair protein 1 homolog [Triplophysa dalaica]XP_056617540.1 swi5-dependent recombination DNA repair protein 1 homolog [Triplophysa dalaica]
METTPKKLSIHETSTNTTPSVSKSSCKTEPMSASLKERLKRTRRTFKSPLSVVKRLKIEDDDHAQTSQAYSNVTEDTDINQCETREQTDCLNNTEHHLRHQCEVLRKEVKQKTETLRRLKMVKMYRKKNDPIQLQRLIEKWRCCAQSVLYELQNELPTEGEKVSLAHLIDNLGLDDKILHFNRIEEDFTDT